MSLNIQGLVTKKRKITELEATASVQDVAIIAIQETWLDQNHYDSESFIPGFWEYKSIRLERIHGGGSTFIRDDLTVTKSDVFNNFGLFSA